MERIAGNRKWLYSAVIIASCIPLGTGGFADRGLYAVWMAGVQLLAASGMFLLMKGLYREPAAVLLGVTLYMTCPYRLALCYEQENPALSTAWALVPWYFYGLSGVKKTGKSRGLSMALAAAALAAVGYESSVMLVVLLLITLFFLLLSKEYLYALIPALGGVLLWLPRGRHFLGYLFTSGTVPEIPISSITEKGYALSDFMTSWVFSEGRPGLGMGLLLGLAALLWTVVAGGNRCSRENKVCLTLAVLCLWGATRFFPWDMVQRLGEWALKFVSLLETPALFFGFACLFLSMAVPACVGALLQEEDRLPARGTLIVIWVAAVGTALYFGLA